MAGVLRRFGTRGGCDPVQASTRPALAELDQALFHRLDEVGTQLMRCDDAIHRIDLAAEHDRGGGSPR